jgi:hypothetical protein
LRTKTAEKKYNTGVASVEDALVSVSEGFQELPRTRQRGREVLRMG